MVITDFGFAVILAENETVRGEPFYFLSDPEKSDPLQSVIE